MTNWFLLELLFLEDLGSNIQDMISSVNDFTILFSRIKRTHYYTLILSNSGHIQHVLSNQFEKTSNSLEIG